MSSNKVMLVAQREYKTTVMTKAFIIGAVILPLVIWGLAIGIPLLVKDQIPPMVGTIAVVDETGQVAAMFESTLSPTFLDFQRDQAQNIADPDEYLRKSAAALGSQGAFAQQVFAINGKRAIERMKNLPAHHLQFENPDAESADIEQLKQRVLGGELLAVVHIKADALEVGSGIPAGMLGGLAGGAPSDLPSESSDGGAERTSGQKAEAPAEPEPGAILYTQRSMHPDNKELLSQRLVGAMSAIRMVQQNVNPAKLMAVMMPPTISVRSVTESGEIKSNEAADILMPLGFMMLLWITTFTGGQYLLTSTVEEKTNKIIEVVLSGTSPMQLMTGKILGQGAVALTMLVIYAALGVGALRQFDLGNLLDPAKLALIAPYFIMAFFFIACMMAAVGSAVNEMREAQALMGPVMMIVMLPLLAWMPIVKSPNGTFATVASFIPPMTPFVMALRLGTNQIIPPWQIAATIVIGFAAVFVFIWMAAKIFRIGILMTGKAPNFMTLLRWVRQA